MRWPFSSGCDAYRLASRTQDAADDDPAISEHIASCHDCAREAHRQGNLDRVWDASRPAEPSVAEWDAMWSRVRDNLDRAETIAAPTIPMPSRPWRRYAMVAAITAQAACLLAGVALWRAREGTVEPAATPGSPAHSNSNPNSIAFVGPIDPLEYDIEPGGVVLIHLEDDDPADVEKMARDDRPGSLDEMLVTFNFVESMAETHPNVHGLPPG